MASNMAYGITALDPRVAATDKFIQEKKIPPDQVEDFLLSMGADPKLASLVFKYRRVQEAAKNQMQGPPSTTTVDQDTSNQYAQLKQQQRMQQGLAGMPAPAIANAPMQGGITGQPVQNAAGGGLMSLAGGGPIAFSNGGRPPRTFTVDPEGNVDVGSSGDIMPYEAPAESAKSGTKRSLFRRIIGSPILRRAGYAGLGLGALSALLGDEEEQPKAEPKVEKVPEGLSEEDYKILAGMQTDEGKDESAARTGVGMPARPKFKRPETPQMLAAIADAEKRVPKDRQAAFAEEMAREEELGETKAIEARRKELAGQKEKATTSPEKKFWMAFAQAGFAASSKGARNLWETLSVGGVEGMKAYETMKQKEADTLEKIADKELQLNSMSAAIKRGAMERGDKRYDDAAKDLRTLRLQHEQQQILLADVENKFNVDMYKTDAAVAAADRRADAARQERKKLLKLDNAIDEAIIKSTDPTLSVQQRQAQSRLAEQLMKQRAAKEGTAASVLAAREKIGAQQAVIRNAQAEATGDEIDLGEM